MENDQIIEIGCYVEVRIPKEKKDSYETENGYNEYIHKVFEGFRKHLKKVGDIKVVHVTPYRYKYNEIPDFDYCISNLCKQNNDFYVYRTFGFNILAFGTNYPKTSPFYNGTQILDELEFNIVQCNLGVWEER